MKFNERLHELRISNKLTALYMSEKMNVSIRNYRYYESGDRTPDLEKIIWIADFFNVSLDYLVGRQFPKK